MRNRRGTLASNTRMTATFTAIDQRLLRWLAHYPLQRAEDLVLGLARWCARPTVYRHLVRLEQAGWITTLRPAWSGGRSLFCLSPAGQCWSAHDEEGTGLAHADAQDALVRLLPRLPVLLTLQDLANGCLTHLANSLTQQRRRPTLVRCNWQLDY